MHTLDRHLKSRCIKQP